MDTNTLPTLTGSEKQIAWAEDIRSKALVELQPLEAKVAAHPEQTHPNIIELKSGIALLKAVADAKWWIDHRDYGIQTMMRDLLGIN